MEDIDYVMTENELYDLIERQQRLQQRAETLEHCVQLRIVASEAIRDRNAATECMAELKMELATLEKDAGDKCFREQQRADAAERERDQALGQSQRAVSEAEEWEKLYDQIKAERDDWKRECDALAKERTQLRKERDEALSRASRLERDEARRVARRLWRQCKAAEAIWNIAYDMDAEYRWDDDEYRVKLFDACTRYEALRLKPRVETND